MEALHMAGGVPPGWQFTLPRGDAAAGREVFVTMQCYTCHHVAGEAFPAHPPRDTGPDLTGMGAHHPATYFAESIINPNAVIITGAGYTGPDGLSRMPEYGEMTIAQLLNLVAYLQSLQAPASHGQPHPARQHTPPSTGSQQHGGSGHGSHQHR
jgi:cbb3-type cytochrome oxidase cytochrome c subunit